MKQSDLNANVRTLIVCFVVGVFSLIPLRFYEVADMMPTQPATQVLGVTSQQVVLPSVAVEQPMVLEAPYDTIETQVKTAPKIVAVEGSASGCVSKGQVEDLIKEANSMKLSEVDRDSLVGAISSLQVCE